MTDRDHQNQKVTLEDLLRLKRAERPTADFWPQFEQELRSKQLAALVDQRPWWRFWPKQPSLLARLAVPFGATAALVFSLVVFRASPLVLHTPVAPASTATATVAVVSPVTASQVAPSSTPTPAVTTPVVVVAVTPATVAPSAQPSVASAAAPAAVATVPTTQSVVTLTPWTSGITPDVVSVGAISPAELSIAHYLANTPPLMSGLAVTDFSVSTEVNSTATEPTPTLSPNELRRARLLAAVQHADEVGVPVSAVDTAARERVSHRLSEELLSVSARRMVDLAGNSVTLRF